MAIRDLSYLISFQTDAAGVDTATTAVKGLADTLDSLSTEPVEIDVDADDVRPAVREIDRLQDALDAVRSSARVPVEVDASGLDRAADDAVEFVDALADIANRQISIDVDASQIEKVKTTLDDVVDIFDQIDSETGASQNAFAQQLVNDANEADAALRQAATAADALREALGESADQFDVDKVVAELKRMGAGFDEIEADADQFADALRRVDGIEMRQLNDGIRSADDGVTRLRSSSEQSRAVLANMTGNAAQDIAQLGGVTGTTGVAISQLTEYAVDGNIALRNLAAAAGPMLALAGVLELVTSRQSNLQENEQWDTDQINEFRDAIREYGDDLETVFRHIDEIEGRTGSRGIWGSLWGEEDDQNLTQELGALGVTLGDIIPLMEAMGSIPGLGTGAAGPAAEEVQKFQQRLHELGVEQSDIVRITEALDGVADNYVAASRAQANETTFFTETLESATAAAERWGTANREIEPTSLTWALIADAANALREGLEPSETQWQAINAVIAQTGWDLDTVLDKGIEVWEANRQGADEAKAAIDAMSDSLADIAEGLDAAALRGEAFTSAVNGLERMSELTQSLELVSFVDGMNSLGDAVKELRDELGSEDFANLDLVPDSWDEVLNMPEELQPVLQALSSFRDSVQSEMAQAFEAGGAPEVQRWAEDTRRAIVDSLRAAGVESDEQIQEILSALGLLPDQVETAIVISNEQQALGVLESIQSVIAGLPPEVQLRIAAVAADDPVAALQLAIAELENADVEVPVELRAIVDGLEADIAAIEESEPTVEVGILPVTKSFNDEMVEVTKDRTTKVTVELDTSQLARNGDPADLNAALAQSGPTITAEMEVGNGAAFEREVDGLTERRTVVVDFVTGRMDLPTNAELEARIGTVRAPIDLYVRHTPRIDGSRLVER